MKEILIDIIVVFLHLIWIVALGASLAGWLPCAVILILSICGVTKWAAFWIACLSWALAIVITKILNLILTTRVRK